METIIYEGHLFRNPDNYEANLFRSKTQRAIDKGIIQRKPCELCGDDEVHAHHEIYSNYLNVRWLCPIHHKKIHSIFNKINREENNIKIFRRMIKVSPDSVLWKVSLESSLKELHSLKSEYKNRIRTKKVSEIASDAVKIGIKELLK